MKLRRIVSVTSVNWFKKKLPLLVVGMFLTAFVDTASALTCGDCHGNPPIDNATRDGSTGRFPGSHDKHAGASNLNLPCTVCHVDNTTPGHRNGSIEMTNPINGDSGASYSKTASFPQTNAPFSGGTCNNVYCHSTVQGANGVGAGTDKPQTWGALGPLGCSACHADMSGASATGRHVKHTNNTAGNYNMPCSNCHPGYTFNSVDNTIHANKTINVAPGSGSYSGGTTPGDNGPGGGYGSCSNVYCHSNANPAGGSNTYTTISWSGTAGCGSCHRTTDTAANMLSTAGTPSPMSASHVQHMATDRYGANSNFTCNSCHAATASNSTTISTPAKHTDGQKDIVFNSWVVSGGTATWNGTQCSNTYCHSNGTVFTGSITHTGFAWTAGNPGCSGCHNSPPSGYATKANAHAKHGSFSCSECHSSVVDGVPSIIDRTLHLNKAYNVFGPKIGSYAPEATPSATGGTCNTITCHGSHNAAWGSTLFCVDCHGNTGASGTETEDFGTGTAASIANGTTADINMIDWDAVGHGKDTGSYASTNPAANLLQFWAGGNKCLFCHDSLVSHNTATNPFRLLNVTTVNKVCMDCHDSAAGNRPGVQPTGASAPKTATRFVGANHYNLGTASNARHNATDLSGGRFCWDCHDPHGTAGNNYMIGLGPSKRLTRRIDTTNYDLGIPYGGASSVGDTRAFGRTNTVTFTAVKGSETRTNYITEAAFDSGKVCQTCHDSTSGIAQYANGLSTNGHNSPSLCTSCHKHDTSGFQGVGDDCVACHSTAALSARHALHSDPDGFLAGKKLSASDYGRITSGGGGIWWYNVTYVSGSPKYACGYCHPQSSATHNNGTRNLNFSPTDTGAAGTIKAKNNATQTFTQNPGVSVTCSSVYCHSNGYASGYVYKTSPDWYGGVFSGDKCQACHGNYPNDAGQTAGSPAHTAHAVGIHYNDIFTGTSGTAATGTGSANSHGNATYSTTINCNACHSGTVTMARNKLGSLCTSCHTGDVAGNTMIIDAAGTSHVSGTVDVSFANVQVMSRAQVRDDITTVAELNNNWSRPASSYKAGATPDDTAKNALNTATMWVSGTKTCSNIACHNGFAVDWTSTTVSCNSCHTTLP